MKLVPQSLCPATAPRQPNAPVRRAVLRLLQKTRRRPQPASLPSIVSRRKEVTTSAAKSNVRSTLDGRTSAQRNEASDCKKVDHRKKEDQAPAQVAASGGRPVLEKAESRRNSLVRRGDYWEISYEGRTSIMGDTRGLRYLAMLIREAGKGAIHASELVALVDGNGSATIELEGKDIVVDSVAENRLIKRLEEIGFERNTATARNNYAKAAELDEELDQVAEELRRIRLPNGSRTTFATSAEKARKAVSKAISESISKIAGYQELEALARHFAAAIQKGQWLSYHGKTEWHVEFHIPRPDSKTLATPKVATARAASSK